MRHRFLRNAHMAIENRQLQRALDQNAELRRLGREAAFAGLPDATALKRRAHAIRTRAIEQLPELLKDLTEKLESNGWIVHHAASADQACAQIIGIAGEMGADLVVKSKSMVTEEIGLNHALMEAHVTPVETDLGEFIVQLRGETPGHIITPAIHLLRKQVAETFMDELGIDYTDDISDMTRAARHKLREAFLTAGVGISGVNFGVAETGTICLVTNEGNGRMVTTLPPVHIAVMGIERIVPTLEDLGIMLQLLPRSATGQTLSSYVTLIQAPRGPQDLDGPHTRHLVLLDNGRSATRDGEMRSILFCIRCGACLNACPVFREVGGHSYESPYPGPIGSVLSAALYSVEEFGHLAKASTLCGACRDVCPVDIDLPTLLLRTRDKSIREIPPGVPSRWAVRLYAWLCTSGRRYSSALKLAGTISRLSLPLGEWISRLPPPLNAWTRYRDFPPFQPRPFRDRYRYMNFTDTAGGHFSGDRDTARGAALTQRPEKPPTIHFEQAVVEAGAEFLRCKVEDLEEVLVTIMSGIDDDQILVDPQVLQHYPTLQPGMETAGFKLVEANLERDLPERERQERLAIQDEPTIGMTMGVAAFADSGSVVVDQSLRSASISSLLPDVHVTLIGPDHVYAGMLEWLTHEGARALRGKQSMVMITGPSRTADIEMSLTIGVHGPGRLIVILVEVH